MSGATLASALVAAQAEMPAVEPNATNPHFRSKFVSLDHLIAKTRPVLNKHGLAITQWPESFGERHALCTRISHESGEFIEHSVPLILGKADMQGLGAAITYARRYAWAAVCGISSEEDDDGESVSNQASSREGADGAAHSPAAPAPDPTDAELELLFTLVASKDGDVDRTRGAADTARKRGKLGEWYRQALTHWQSVEDPIPFGEAA